MLWNIQPFDKRSDAFAKDLGMESLIAHLLLSRGIDSSEKVEDFFAPDYEKHLHNPFLFTDLPRITERIRKALLDEETVGVFGDYDADGVTGSVVLREALEGLGLNVVVHIPDKHKEGHGLSKEGIEVFKNAGVHLFFTVDCGITNITEIAFAKEMGLECIIIDHHHVPEIMPDALAIINPKVPQSGYPFADLCGAGTAFKVSQGIYQKLAPQKTDQLKWLLDAVAIGTVADCMPIVDENRVFVRYGCVVLAKTRRIGLRKLYEVGRIPIDDSRHPDAMMIAFQIAPRINAAGRMAHARLAHNLLVEKNDDQASLFAKELEDHNNDRRKLSAKIAKQIQTRVKKECLQKNTIVFSDESYPLGIVGLIAGKIAEEFHKPTMILTRGEEFSQGSLRSARGIHLVEILKQCEDLLEKYGGHAQAAGLTVSHKNFPLLQERFEELVSQELLNEKKDITRLIDAELLIQHLHKDFLRNLRRFEPFGEGNPEPLFLVRNAVITDVRFLGNDNKHLKLKLRIGEGKDMLIIDAIGFSLGEKFSHIAPKDTVHIIGKFQENEWNGRTSLQIMIEDIRTKEEDFS